MEIPMEEKDGILIVSELGARKIVECGYPGGIKELMRQAFVAGAKWWEYDQTQFTMWQSDQNKAYEASTQKVNNILREIVEGIR